MAKDVAIDLTEALAAPALQPGMQGVIADWSSDQRAFKNVGPWHSRTMQSNLRTLLVSRGLACVPTASRGGRLLPVMLDLCFAQRAGSH